MSKMARTLYRMLLAISSTVFIFSAIFTYKSIGLDYTPRQFGNFLFILGLSFFTSIYFFVKIKEKKNTKKEDAMERGIKLLRKHLESLTEEEKEEIREKFRDKRPKGWLSIEEHLPMMKALDIMQGYSEYRIKDKDGNEGTANVGDGNIWYYLAKEAGITHWFNE